ncbi:Uncharacterised protein [Mycobacteroides abscessus subsp. abscessus]|nr:Uncharacterised protein [Mycobacteroides abscessus subsp. abscessus]
MARVCALRKVRQDNSHAAVAERAARESSAISPSSANRDSTAGGMMKRWHIPTDPTRSRPCALIARAVKCQVRFVRSVLGHTA